MGEVYLATDTRLKRTVALKRLAPHLRTDERYRERLVKEAERASRLDLQHIAAIYDVIEEAGEVFLVMEYVEGSDLRHAVINPQNTPEILSIATQCAEALAAAHAVGVLHRDIKPENIMLKPDGTVKVLDFGLARELSYGAPHDDTAATVSVETRAPAGTAGYVAPEVLLEKNIDARADVFSLGVVFYELLTRRHPFRTESFVGTCDRVLHYEPTLLRQSNPNVPPELERIVHKMLAKDRDERYATVADLLADLRALVRHGTSASFPAPRVALRPTRKLRWHWWAGAAVIAVAIAAGLLWMLTRGGGGVRVGSALPQQKHIAVLPFRVIGGDAEQNTLAEGLAVSVTVKLTRLTTQHPFQVAAASEVHNAKVVTAEDARRELGATVALETTLQQRGERLLVSLSLVDTKTRTAIDAQEFPLPQSELITLEDRVVTGLAQMLGLRLGEPERVLLGSIGTASSQAYKLYQQGRGYLQDFERPDNIDLAVQAFETALKLDGNYAQAFAGRGEAYWRKYRATEETRWLAPARESCERAVTLNRELAAGHACLGEMAESTGNPADAVLHFRRAIELDASSDSAYRGLAKAYMDLGRLNEAEATYQRAIDVRPYYWAGYSALGAFLAERGRYEEAARQFQKAIDTAPENAAGHRQLGGVYIYMGRYTQAEAALRKSLNIRPTPAAYSNLGNALLGQRRFAEAVSSFEQGAQMEALTYSAQWNLARAYHFSGRQKEARATFTQLVKRGQERLQVNPRNTDTHVLMAYSYAALGNVSDAERHLARALTLQPENPEYFFFAALVQQQMGKPAEAVTSLELAVSRGYSLHDIRNAPEFDSLGGNPRFKALSSRK
jgi:serine/threonine-protein kinase